MYPIDGGIYSLMMHMQAEKPKLTKLKEERKQLSKSLQQLQVIDLCGAQY
jgi:hypothetical protein